MMHQTAHRLLQRPWPSGSVEIEIDGSQQSRSTPRRAWPSVTPIPSSCITPGVYGKLAKQRKSIGAQSLLLQEKYLHASRLASRIYIIWVLSNPQSRARESKPT